jgi:RHS repeat-associated protein
LISSGIQNNNIVKVKKTPMEQKKTNFLLYAKLIALLFFSQGAFGQVQIWNPSFSIGSSNNIYNYAPGQTPAEIIELYQAAIPTTGVTYQWYSSSLPDGTFTAISGATTINYSPPALTTASTTIYYKLAAIDASLNPTTVYSNVVKYSIASVNWEDINYIREHDVLRIGQTSWTVIDTMSIGTKLQTSTYLDGLGRPIQKISKQTATPPSGSTTWGDVVQFSIYDSFNRESLKYLPYTTTNQLGKFKTAPLTDQPAYYSNPLTYNETSAYDSIKFDKSPLNRTSIVKEPGYSWANNSGDSVKYDVNNVSDSVQIWNTDYTQGDAPVNGGLYQPNTLYKITYIDVNDRAVIEYTNMSGQLILKKVQIDIVPTTGHAGWICTYSVYDDFGLLRFQIQPEGVKYLDANSWSFAGTNGATVLAEQVFQYNYDDKGRTTWKKSPGASPMTMLYDIRDRVVFMQDGNQATFTTPQWTANLYDVLDRPVITTLYNTTETISSLQTDIANSYPTSSVTITNTGTATVTASLSLNPISSTNLNSTTACTIVKYLFYDNYLTSNFSSFKSFNTAYTNLSAYSTSDPNVIPIAASQRVWSMPVGSMTRVLTTNVFLIATEYFDEKGRHIQTLLDNIKTGVDINTLQYYFDGRLLSSCNSHTSTGTGYSAYVTLTKYIFDNIGRVTSIQKQFSTNAFKTMSAYDYDDIGRVLTKHLDPNYNNPNSGLPDLESLNYTFNIHNQLTGINKDYALKNPADYNKWGHFFGLYLGFDNKDNVFAKAQLNGQVTGQQWNSLGDDAQRKYDYTYDNARRLVIAAFNQQQHPGDGWSNSTMDFSVSGTSGQITYDYNGNLQTMLQKGVMPGTTSPFTIDDLRYTYNTYSNRLKSVTDSMTTTSLNGQFGDFIDGANVAGSADYVYDANGNIVVDLNKNLQSLNNGAPGTNGVHYNFLDKPDQIRIVGKGTILIVYDADGRKLQRAFVPDAGGSGTVTTYINQYIFQETATLTTSSPAPFSGTGVHLAYMNFEEGRIRAMTTTSTSNGYDALSENGNLTLPGTNISGAIDYFITDYQQNVRMILTEETHSATNTCTEEPSRASAEDPVFGQTGAGNEVEVTRYAKPSGWTNNSSSYVSQTGTLSGHFIGPNTLQKVMAGDLVSANVQYYYVNPNFTASNPNIISTLLTSLGSAISGNATVGELTHGASSGITSNLSGVSGFTSAVEPNSDTAGTAQAYLTVLFFDERFNFIAASDGGVAQVPVASTWTTSTPPLTLTNVKAPKNGYVYIYVSNRSNQDVYFDNLVVNLVTSNIIEENHYYAFGLKIAGISSKKLGDINEGKLSNPYQYNEKEMLDEDAGLNWYDYGYRNYDPQIGKFVQLDPLSEDFPFLTPYQYASNDPITNIDMDGLEGIPCPGTSGFSILLGNIGHAISAFFDGVSSFSRVASISSSVVSTLRISSMAVSTNSQQLIVTQEIAGNSINGNTSSSEVGSITGNTSKSPGGSGTGGPNEDDYDDADINLFPPIFWNEEFFQDIERVDLQYYETLAPPGQKLELTAFPNYVFLVFHYLDNSGQAEKNRYESFKAYKGPKNPNSAMLNLHEVPYASTIEGGAKAMRSLASKMQNIAHGVALGKFYSNFKLKAGDVFLVPLFRVTSNLPAPIPVPQTQTQPKYDPSSLIRKTNPTPPKIFIPVFIPVAAEAAEGFEAVDLIWLLIFL